MKWNIVIDSSCDLKSTDASADIGLEVVPLTITIDGKDFIDDDNIDVEALMDAAKVKKESSSACPAPAEWYERFAKADCSVCFTMTSKLSGTYNSAVQGAKMLMEEQPEKKVFVLDSKSTAGKLVQLKMKAEELIRAGLEPEEVFARLEKYNEETLTVFALGSYEMHVDTGRMDEKGTSTNLGFRPVGHADNGMIEPFARPRGEKAAIDTMIDWILGKNKEISRVVISHCANPDGAQALKERIIARVGTEDIHIYACKGLTTYYSMKNALIVSF